MSESQDHAVRVLARLLTAAEADNRRNHDLYKVTKEQADFAVERCKQATEEVRELNDQNQLIRNQNTRLVKERMEFYERCGDLTGLINEAIDELRNGKAARTVIRLLKGSKR